MDHTHEALSGGAGGTLPLSAGCAAPDFEIARGTDGPVMLSGLRGDMVVLVFSPPGWDPAHDEQRAQYERALALFPGLRARIVDVSGSTGTAATVEVDREQYRVYAGIDPSSAVAQAYGVAGRSALFVVGEDGRICWSHAAPIGVAAAADALTEGLKASAGASRAGRLTLSRRQFVAAAIGAAFVLSLAGAGRSLDSASPANAATATASGVAPGAFPIVLAVNGEQHTLSLDPRVTLLDALREYIGLTGTKKGCDHGQCGACTVHVDGRRMNSCLLLAATVQGRKITTVEGLAHGETLTPLQTAFIEHDAFQCGYCTPGQLMSATALLTEEVGKSDDDVRVAMSGNLCRCGAYPNIVAAIQSVRKERADASV